MIHPTALVESESIGQDTNVWAYAHVMDGARVGSRVNIGDHAFIETGAIVGDNVTIKNAVLIWEGVEIENDVFVGPRVVFTNDRAPRSPRMPAVQDRYSRKDQWLEHTYVRQGCSIGAGAIICPGIELGIFSTIAAGAVVTKHVKPHALVVGTPAVHVADVCTCGQKLAESYRTSICQVCGETPMTRMEQLNQLHNSSAA